MRNWIGREAAHEKTFEKTVFGRLKRMEGTGKEGRTNAKYGCFVSAVRLK
jgi:hypothetical protein